MPFAPRTPFDWRLRTRTLALGPRTLLMGILNVTPDSFSDGGQFYTSSHTPDRALAQALHLLDEGADLLDLGGESTRPNATPLSPEEEQARILPVLKALLKARPDTIVSVDTFHAATARLAVDAGAEIVNDVSGHTWDAAMSKTCADLQCGVVLMHTRGRPQAWTTQPPLPPIAVMPVILTGLRDSLLAARTAGVQADHIVLDPGFGFGKRGAENYTLHALLSQLQQFGLPLLTGSSRKSFLTQTAAQWITARTTTEPGAPNRASSPDPQTWDHSTTARTITEAGAPGLDSQTRVLPSGPILGADPQTRIHTTLASNVAAILAGAHILRVHDVRPAAEAAAIADAILAAAAVVEAANPTFTRDTSTTPQ